MSDKFLKFSNKVSNFAGSPKAFIIAFSVVCIWFSTGFYFKWSETHSLFINTLTTIVTFLMTFLIQSGVNRDSKAFHIKLNELVRSQKESDNKMIGVEDLPEKEIKKIKEGFKGLSDE